MKIAYIGDLLNYGRYLSTFGTGLLLQLSEMDKVDEIDVLCPRRNSEIENLNFNNKVKIHETYEYNDNLILFKLLRGINSADSDIILFNLIPTSFGKSSLANLEGLLSPLTLSFFKKRTKIIYHNSTFANDYRKLGYSSFYDNLRAKALGVLEKSLFKKTEVYVTLKTYVERIREKTGIEVKYVNTKGIEAIPTVYLNDLQNREYVELPKNDVPLILLHGYWGPQKNLELALKVLSKLRNEGDKFEVMITGGINEHFDYSTYFYETLKKHGFESKYRGKVSEKEINELFTKADLVLLPYNTPGGKSGVLEQAMFFEIPIVSVDFPEYREQAEGYNKVVFCQNAEFEKCVKYALENLKKPKYINIKENLSKIKDNISRLLS
jgi:glycosyltransferase involved in cell wall biosynthesis